MAYVSRCYRNLCTAGNKAKTDNEATMRELGFVNLGLPQRVGGSKVFIFFYNLASVAKACCAVRPGDRLVLQYPVKKYFALLCRVARARGARVIALVHDLGSMRRHRLTVEQEVRRLSHAHCVVASNEAMARWLRQAGLRVPVAVLGLWDYRSPEAVLPAVRGGEGAALPRVVYAGSLNPRKNSFFRLLPSVIKGYQLNLYGDTRWGLTLRGCHDLVFRGHIPAGDVDRLAQYDYGLVWDGDSIDACTGDFGGYLRLNTPHKASFYLRAGLPLVVWSGAAIAPLVERDGLGVAVDSLRDLPAALLRVTPARYGRMRGNAAALAMRLNCGESFKKAVGRACEQLN